MEGTQEVHNSVVLKLTTSSKDNYCKIRNGNKISGNQRQEWKMFEPMDGVLGCKPSVMKNQNTSSKGGIEHVSTQPSTSTKDLEFTSKKRKNIARFATATKFLETNNKNGRCLNQETL